MSILPLDIAQLDVSTLTHRQAQGETDPQAERLTCKVCPEDATKRLTVTIAVRNEKKFSFHPLDSLHYLLCDDHAFHAVETYLNLIPEPPDGQDGS